jgi:predicted PurR-regulated permease PerM
MLGLEARAARVTWTVFLVGLSLYLLYTIRRTLFIFIGALLLAYLLSPLVDLADRLLPKKAPRTIALALVYAVLLGVLTFLGFTLGSIIANEANVLAARLPVLFQQLQQPTNWPIPGWLQPLAQKTVGVIQSSAEESIPFFQRAGRETLSFLSNAVYVFLVPILAFFFLKDGAQMSQSILGQFEEGPRRSLLADVAADVNLLLAHYMRSLVLLCLATFASYSICFSAARLPFALLLASLAGVLEFVPMIGPLLASIIVLTVGWFNGYPHLLAIFLFMLVYRGFQDYILAPRLMGRGAELHPLLVVFGVLAGDQIAGVAGIFLSVPVLATLRIVYMRFQKSRWAGALAGEGLH